ncbi:uncharacterized protein LOC120338300 [Styela clava]
MRFRKIRKIGRWKNWRLISVVISCFTFGLFVGWVGNTDQIKEEIELRVDHAPPDAREDWMDNREGIEILGRKKLSVKDEKVIQPFSRIPPNYEKIVLPPRAPTNKFDIEPYRIMKRNKVSGKEGAHHFMLFIVKSAPIHTTRREVIRKTWGAVKEVDGLLFNTIFVVGQVDPNSPLQHILEKENKINGDMLQTGTPEGYINLPSKVLSAMQWLISKSSQISSDFYTFTDDDCVMNIANIVDFFGNLPFEDDENDSSKRFDRSKSSQSIKEIQTIELYKKKKVNEVTLPPLEAKKLTKSIINEVKYEDSKRQLYDSFEGEQRSKEGDEDDVAENLEIYAAMDPNAKIQIERIEKDDANFDQNESLYGDIPIISNFKQYTSNFMPHNYNPAYKNNSYNLIQYLETALQEKDPGIIFRKHRLVPDGLYCGFSYDPQGKPHRRMTDKWGVTKEQYSFDVYPSFCHGGMYTMSGNLMTSIFAISTVTDYHSYHLEDVLITGILREKTGVPDSKMIRRGTDPKVKPLMYYVWDSGPRVLLKMARKWKFYNRPLFSKRFAMEALRNGEVISWNNYGKS